MWIRISIASLALFLMPVFPGPFSLPAFAQQKQSEKEDPTGWESVNRDQQKATILGLIRSTEDPEEMVQIEALSVLGRSTILHEEIMECLLARIQEPDEDVANAAAASFKRLTVQPVKKTASLILLLESDKPDVVNRAADLLSSLIVDDASIKLCLDHIEAQMTPNQVKEKLFLSLRSWGNQLEPATGRLIKMYDTCTNWRLQILQVLQTVEVDAKSIVPLYSRALKDEKANVRMLAVRGLSKTIKDPYVSARNRDPAVASYVESVFRVYDKDNNGLIEADEISGRSLLDKFDQSNDDKISKSEMTLILSKDQRLRTLSRSRSRTRSLPARR